LQTTILWLDLSEMYWTDNENNSTINCNKYDRGITKYNVCPKLVRPQIFTLTQVAFCFQSWIYSICSFCAVRFCHQQYCESAVFFYVHMVQTEGFQTKEVILNSDQWLLSFITNYFRNLCSQVPKYVSRKKNITASV